jgi:hypothetical protein
MKDTDPSHRESMTPQEIVAQAQREVDETKAIVKARR